MFTVKSKCFGQFVVILHLFSLTIADVPMQLEVSKWADNVQICWEKEELQICAIPTWTVGVLFLLVFSRLRDCASGISDSSGVCVRVCNHKCQTASQMDLIEVIVEGNATCVLDSETTINQSLKNKNNNFFQVNDRLVKRTIERLNYLLLIGFVSTLNANLQRLQQDDRSFLVNIAWHLQRQSVKRLRFLARSP